jgi:hypothetical protein
MRVISQKLRDFAKGKECTLRLPGICNFNPETTVLAHLPCGQKGVGMKSPDHFAIHCCSACHSEIDGARRWEIPAQDYLRALAETQLRLIEAGLITVRGMK